MRQMELGRDCITYGGPGADVELLTEEERIGLFGPDDPARPPLWPTDDQWSLFNERSVAAIAERAEPGELLLLAGGSSQQPIADQLPHLTACEPGVGYEGIATDFCAFESYAWMHHVYGARGLDGRYFDAVIPNNFDVAEFPHLNQGGGDYLLFVGRLIVRKGLTAAANVAKAAGMRLVVAGPGAAHAEPGVLITDDGQTLLGDVEYAGVLNAAARAELMAGAVALLAPTGYVEPFGGVAVEAQMCGTPAITTDFGAFTETVAPEFRFRTLAEGVAAVEAARYVDHRALRDRARSRYAVQAVAPLYAAWFDRLDTLYGDGWYAA
jgi:glycosyltransferase involved in cell wall biosynthesis